MTNLQTDTVPDEERVLPITRRKPNNRLTWIALGLAALALALMGWFVLQRPPELHGIVLASPRQADDFTLTGSTGEPLSLSQFRGKYVLLYFGYTSCPDVCPTTLNDLAQMAKTLGEERMEDVQVILISVDPERDTPERLATYTQAFHRSFMGMTGTLEQIQAVASQYGIFFARSEPAAGEAADPAPDANYTVDHTSVVTIIDPEGYVRMVIPYGVSGADIASDLTYLMRRW